MNKEELKNIENHRQELIKENNTLTNLLEIERKQVGRLAEQLNLSSVSNNEVALKAFVEEYVEAFEDGQGSDTALYIQAKSLL